MISSVTIIKIIIQGDSGGKVNILRGDGIGQVYVQLQSVSQYGSDGLHNLNNIFTVVLITIDSSFSKM
jgi:hypothetical protein